VTYVLIGLVALALWGVFLFNRLVRLRTQMHGAWADIDVQLKRRHDLVPQLVSAVKAYAGHERATLEAVPRPRRTCRPPMRPRRSR
jgi:LemA protein